MLDDGKELRVSEWNTADCNIEQAAIYTDYDHKVYLLVSERLLGSSEKILAQDEPEKQKIRVFRLMLNINSEPGLPRAYFSKVREQISNESACGYGEIDRILRKVIQ